MLTPLAFLLVGLAPDSPTDLLTVAEASRYQRTATHAEVTELVQRLDSLGEHVFVTELGRSFEGRTLPLVVCANPPVRSAAEARGSGKPIVFAFGDIHAGEVCGKEALLALARELTLDPAHPLLAELVVVLAPILNADGNDRMSTENRRGQVGPAEGCGERANAQGLDLNRDWIKLEAPETRAIVRFLTEWDPHLTIDTHTTNGSHHRYVLTYAPPLCPAGDAEATAFVRDELLPAVARALFQRTGYDTFPYGNFDRDRTSWRTYSAHPRFGGPYRGLRGQPTILSEAYAYASYETRVKATLEFVREILRTAARDAGRLEALRERVHERARDTRSLRPAEPVGLRFEPVDSGPAVVRGWLELEDDAGRRSPTATPRDYPVRLVDRFRATKTTLPPRLYAIPAALDDVVRNLEHHGIETFVLKREARDLAFEVATVRSLERAEREFQGHHAVTLEVDWRTEVRTLPAGTTLVAPNQRLGRLAVFLLEPESQDGLVTWNLLDDHLAVGADYPILRLR